MSTVTKTERICDGCKSVIPDGVAGESLGITISGSLEVMLRGNRLIGYGGDGMKVELDYCDGNCFGLHLQNIDLSRVRNESIDNAARQAGL